MIAALLTLIVVLQAADVYTTWRVLTRGGIERNPAMAWLIQRLGLLPALLLAKAVFIALLLACDSVHLLTWWMLALTACMYLCVLAQNVRAMREQA